MFSQALIGVDLGGTNVRVGKVRGEGVVKKSSRRISGKEAEDVVLDEIFATIDEVIDDDVVGIGCGVPSVVDVERGIVYTVENIPSWQEVHLKDKLEQRYGRPSYINNDANAFVLGELYFGKAQGYRNVVALTLGTGLGGGVVCDGKLYAGANCGAGEFGTIPYRDHTIEYYAAGQFFKHRAGVGGEVIFDRATNGDAAALSLFEEYGHELGFAMLVVLYAYDPELVIFGGSISSAFPFFEESMRKRLAGFAYQKALDKLVITCSEAPDVALLGAAALHLDATRQKNNPMQDQKD
jgi:glucokinase